jgi:hypothetical protein
MRNYFRATKNYPYHFSVGAVVLNEKDEVLCHHFKDLLHGGMSIKDLYLLMRETPDPGETIKETIDRGLMEEFGAKAEIEKMLGSIVSSFPEKDLKIEKTTLYFLCRLKSIDINNRDKDDPEAGSEILFLPRKDLIKKMNIQGKKYHRSDWNESQILERIK